MSGGAGLVIVSLLGVRDAPQWPQNRCDDGWVCPQAGHRITRGVYPTPMSYQLTSDQREDSFQGLSRALSRQVRQIDVPDAGAPEFADGPRADRFRALA